MPNLLQIVKGLRNGSLNSIDLYERCLTVVKTTRKLNSFVNVTEDVGKKEANESFVRYREGRPFGPLDGIPIAIKDNFNVSGVTTTCASQMLSNYVPTYTATVVEKLLAQGSLLMGKTNMDEFAMGTGSVDSCHGPVKNPWHSTNDVQEVADSSDDFFVCGGSSGGSAVAVATGAAFIALGSDTGGSTRSPAAMCGVVGLKPTYGMLSRHGLISLVNSMDVPGILTGSVDDAALTLGLLAGFDPRDSTTFSNTEKPFSIPNNPSVRGIRVGIPQEFYAANLSEEVAETWHVVANILESGGAELKTVSMPHTPHSIACYSVLNSCEVASNFARYDGIEFGLRLEEDASTESLFAKSRREGFNTVVRERILAGNYFLLKRNYDRYFTKAQKVRRLICRDYERVFGEGTDVLLTPVVLGEAPTFKDFTSRHNREQVATQDFCTQPVNMAGIPAISIPIRLSKNNLPLSLQLIANNCEEKLLLTVAKFVEERVCFPKLLKV